MKKILYINLKKNKRLKFFIGSSETTREAPFNKIRINTIRKNSINFNFDAYVSYSPLHIKNINYSFLEWFIGFAEGDGTFYSQKLKNDKMRLSFEIGQKDPKVLYLIKKVLGFGLIHSRQKKNTNQPYWVYRIQTKKNIQRLIHLLNGNLVLTKRRVQFNKWLKKAKKMNIVPFNLRTKNISIYNGVQISLKTGWLSGFIDAEGCFYATLSTPSTCSLLTPSIKQKMHITQKKVYNEDELLQKIGVLFLSTAQVKPLSSKKIRKQNNLLASKSKQLESSFRIEISSLASHKCIMQYLSKFKLKTNKWISFCRWSRVVMAREKNYHLCEENLPKLLQLCKAINMTNLIQ